jgi:alpha-maltose-1-phosphate synthase
VEDVEGRQEGAGGGVTTGPVDPAVDAKKRLSILLSHPTGNQNVRNALRSLAEREMLAEFWTTLAWNPESKWNGLLPAGLRSKLEKRAYPEAPKESVKCVPSREIVRLVARGSFLDDFLCSGERPFSVIGMYRHFDGQVARRVRTTKLDAVYAYEGGALLTFREAKKAGAATFYELPSSHWYWENKLLAEEAERNPQFAALIPKLKDSPRHMEWKDEELRLADFVIVPSHHVRDTLAGVVPEEKIRVVGYGAPPVQQRNPDASDAKRPLKVLFVGALMQRKGIGYLLDAVDTLGSEVELTLVGGRVAANARVDAACKRWRWFERVTHAEVLNLMLEADVLVLPSLAEGCALVVLEAAACGLPVIVTPNTGAIEFVRDGREGYVVPICNSDAIADRLHSLHEDREMLAAMSRDAQATAAGRSWEGYRAKLAETVRAEL